MRNDLLVVFRWERGQSRVTYEAQLMREGGEFEGGQTTQSTCSGWSRGLTCLVLRTDGTCLGGAAGRRLLVGTRALDDCKQTVWMPRLSGSNRHLAPSWRRTLRALAPVASGFDLQHHGWYERHGKRELIATKCMFIRRSLS
jgi:hypothetical protein